MQDTNCSGRTACGSAVLFLSHRCDELVCQVVASVVCPDGRVFAERHPIPTAEEEPEVLRVLRGKTSALSP